MRLIIIALVAIGCHNGSNPNGTAKISNEPLDTILTAPVNTTVLPALFETAFIKGTTHEVAGISFSLYGITIGSIKLPSGKIVACDPMHIDEYGKPFTQVFPTGDYPVQLSIMKVDGEEEIAFARIKFSDAPVVKWQPALLAGQQPLPLEAKDIHGYSVDAGVGVYVDEEAKNALDFNAVENTSGTLYKEMDKHYRKDYRYAVYAFGNHNLAAFTSGFGDGYYATYIGFDALGKPCRLVTDFGIIDWKHPN